MAVVAALAFFTGLCAVNNVEVTGNSFLTPDYIQEVSGLAIGENLITLNVGRLKDNLKNNNWIEEVVISRHLLHTVKINIKERVPAAIVDFGGSRFLVDETGYVITNEVPPNFNTIPAVYGGENYKPEIGEVLKDKLVKEAVGIIAEMPENVRSSITIWNPYDGRGHVFNTSAGFQVVYGDAEEEEKKKDILEAIYIDVVTNNRNISYIDIRVTDSPVTGN